MKCIDAFLIKTDVLFRIAEQHLLHLVKGLFYLLGPKSPLFLFFFLVVLASYFWHSAKEKSCPFFLLFSLSPGHVVKGELERVEVKKLKPTLQYC